MAERIEAFEEHHAEGDIVTEGVVIIAIVAASAAAIATLVIGIAGPGVSQVLKTWLNRPGRIGTPQTDPTEIRAGLGQLQQSVDAIAIEVERLSEGQRFTTKLLSEKAREVAPGVEPSSK